MVRAATRPSSVWVGGMRMSTIATSGLCIATCRSRSSGLSDWREHLEARVLEQPDDTLAEEDRVLGDDDAHRVAEHRDRVAKRREIAREPVCEHLEDVVGLGSPRGDGSPRSRIVALGTEPCVAAEASICPPCPAEPIRAARCTSMPVYPSSVTIASPVWRPMRTRTGLTPAHSCSISARCADTEAATASPASTNAAKSSSPCASMTVPLCAATVSRRILRSSARIAA